MATNGRRAANATGQLDIELRNRDTSGFQSSRLAALSALLDSIGPPAWASGPTAAALHRFDGFALAAPFHVRIERGRNVNRIGHLIHTTADLDEIDCESAVGVPVFAPTRVLIDLARSASDEQLTGAVDAALRDGLTSDDHLHRRISDLRSSGRYGVPRLVALLERREITGGTQSWLEREYLRLLQAARLPLPIAQVVLGRRRDCLIRVDFHFPGTPVVVEVLGYRWHRTTAQMSVDAERVTRLTLDGKVVVQFTYEHITKDPNYVTATTVEALRT